MKKHDTLRHNIMSSIKSKDTKPEMVVRHWLWVRGYRYRLNYNRLPGHPDLVLRKYRTCIFINGCFWHGHGINFVNSHIEVDKRHSCFRPPKTNKDYWESKIAKNKERDHAEQKKLADMGWHCITVWECELKPKHREQTLKSLVYTLNKIWLEDHAVIRKPYPKIESDDGILMAAEPEE